jgi:hypothetical protein
MSWNHRVIKEEGEDLFQIHEVYYDDEGNIVTWTAEPVAPCGESLEILIKEIAMFLQAVDKPVLHVDGTTLREDLPEGS